MTLFTAIVPHYSHVLEFMNIYIHNKGIGSRLKFCEVINILIEPVKVPVYDQII